MLAFMTLSLLAFAHRSFGSDQLEKLQRIHPTWTFELVSVESVINETLSRLKAVDLDLTEDVLRAKIGANLSPEVTHVVRKVGDPKWSKHPAAKFDAREEWKACSKLMNEMDDEGACYTDVPPVVASVAADRYCIHTNGTSKKRLSTEMLTGCADFCTKSPWIFYSMNYITKHGIPTGGSYKSNEGCLPYTLGPCKHSNSSYVSHTEDEIQDDRGSKENLTPCEEVTKYDHACPKKCSNQKYPKSLDEDLIKYTTWYILINNEFHVRNEIIAYGPMSTSILMFDDFFQYPQKGMYRIHKGSKLLAPHKFLKVIGWGEEEETKYWLVMNTWDNWGPSKVFKIPRGVNYACVEYMFTAGVYEPIDSP